MKKRDLYQEITDTVVTALEDGVAPWVQPWDPGFPRNGKTGRVYQGINVFLLWISASRQGFLSQEWMTFNQAKALGACVIKGEKATQVVFWKPIEVEETDPETGEDAPRTFPVLKHFNVFNRAQIRGLPLEQQPRRLPRPARHLRAEAFIKNTKAGIHHGGTKASYIPSQDLIRLPHFERFETGEDYYATALHELAHWTGHPTRLDRDLDGRFGDQAYAAEYIGAWLKILRADKRAVFAAASKAKQAYQYLEGLQPAKP